MTTNIAMNIARDESWMRAALAEAERAEAADEVPVGAVVVCDARIVGRGHNAPLSLNDPTAHAEVLALRQAGREMRNYRLVDTTLYTTVEPCLMCMGAMLHARVKRVVFGCFDPKGGVVGSLYNLPMDTRLNHRLEVTSGIGAGESRALLHRFFRDKRQR